MAAVRALRRGGPPAVPSLAILGAIGFAAVFGLLTVRDPGVALLAALALAFVAISVVDVALGLIAFAFLSFIEVLPGMGDVSAAKFAGLVLAVSWIATLAARPRARRELVGDHPVFAVLVCLFLAWSAASAVWAEDPDASLYASMRYLLNIALVFIAYTALRRRSHVWWFVAMLVAGALASAAFGLLLAPGGAEAGADGRLSGAGVDPNYLATTLAAVSVLALVVAACRDVAPVARLAAVAASAVSALALVSTLSRTGLAALGAALIAGALLAGPSRRLPALIAATAAAGLVVGYFAALAPPAAVERVTELAGGTGRTDIWTVGWRMVEAEPARGVGSGNFPIASVHYLLEPGALLRDDFIVDQPKVAHNVYLEVMAELGVPGLALFLAVVGFLLGCGVVAARRFERAGDRSMGLLARGAVVACVAVLAGAFFISIQHFKPVWLILALNPSLLALAPPNGRRRAAAAPGLAAPRSPRA